METATLISTGAIAASALVGFFNLIMTGLLTRSIHLHSVRAAELDALRQNSEQWRQLNLAAIQNPRVQSLLDGDAAVSTDERAMRRNVIFYILNGLHELFLAARSGILKAEEANRIIGQQMTALAPHESEVESVFGLARGYDPVFTALVRRQLRDLRGPTRPVA